MEVLLMAVLAASNIACFLIGARVGQKTAKGEEIRLAVKPAEAVQERREKREAEREQARVDAILHNIDNYDGTGIGQIDVPGR